MIRNIESVGARRAAIAVMLPLFLIVGPFVTIFGYGKEAVKEYCKGVSEVIGNCRDMWSKDFKPCK